MRTRIILFLLAVTPLVGHTAGTATPLEFKGLPLGVSKAKFLEKLPLFSCDGEICWFAFHNLYFDRCNKSYGAVACDRAWKALMEYGPAEAQSYRAEFVAGGLRKIVIEFRHPPSEMESTINEKYGLPTRNETTTAVRKLRWDMAEGTIQLDFGQSAFGSSENATVTITSRDYEQMIQKTEEEKLKTIAKKSVKNL